MYHKYHLEFLAQLWLATIANIRSCVLCDEAILLDDKASYNKLFKKGVEGLNKASHARGIYDKDITMQEGLHVHVECRKAYINPKYIASIDNNNNEVQKPAIPENSLR